MKAHIASHRLARIMVDRLICLLLLLSYASTALAFQLSLKPCRYRPSLRIPGPRMAMDDLASQSIEQLLRNENGDLKTITVEVISRRSVTQERSLAYDGLYKEVKEDKFAVVRDSPFAKGLSILFSPGLLCLAIYFSSFGWSKILWLGRKLNLVKKASPPKKTGSATAAATVDVDAPEKPVSVESLPFQIYECEKCGMELRPARGRAQAVFSRPRFRCARCGAKAESYFDIDDMNDPRAVARQERLEQEKLDEEQGDDEEE
jgi:hypothetical protein